MKVSIYIGHPLYFLCLRYLGTQLRQNNIKIDDNAPAGIITVLLTSSLWLKVNPNTVEKEGIRNRGIRWILATGS